MGISQGVCDLYKSELRICSGSYEIIDIKEKKPQKIQLGLLDVFGVSTPVLARLSRHVEDSQDFYLALSDGRKYKVRLRIIPEDVDYFKGYARFIFEFVDLHDSGKSK